MTSDDRSRTSVDVGIRPANLVQSARAVAGREPGLFVVGVGGVVLAAVCLIAVAVRGRFVPPEGKMLDAPPAASVSGCSP